MDIDRELQDFLEQKAGEAEAEEKRAVWQFYREHPKFTITHRNVYLFLFIGLLVSSIKSYRSPFTKREAEWALEKREESKSEPSQPKTPSTPKAPSTTPKPRPHGEPPSPAPEGMRWHWRDHKGGEGK